MTRAILLTLSLAASAFAHQIEELPLTLRAERDRYLAILHVDAAYMLPEFRGDSEIAALDLAWLRTRSANEWHRIQVETEAYLNGSLKLDPSPDTLAFPDFANDPPAFMQGADPETPPILEVRIEGPLPAEGLKLSWNEPLDVVLVVEKGDDTLPVMSGETLIFFEKNSPSSPPSFGRWIALGFRHIVPEGVDHILFILGIFLLLARWQPLLNQSLVFTLAHSITLALASLGWVDIPRRPVEVLIALSIVWVALENLWLKSKHPSRGRYLLIAVFGLMHGLGFAGMLTPLLPDKRGLVPALIGFNLGVEVGQVVILGLAFALFAWWKPPAFDKLRRYGSIAIAIAGAIWIVQRL